MSEDVIEEDLLNSIDEVDNQIKNFRQRVRAVLDAAQAEGTRRNEKEERARRCKQRVDLPERGWLGCLLF